MTTLEPRPRGYRNRKLTEEQVRAIRAEPMTEKRDIYWVAAKYGVSRETIRKIRQRLTYRDVE